MSGLVDELLPPKAVYICVEVDATSDRVSRKGSSSLGSGEEGTTSRSKVSRGGCGGDKSVVVEDSTGVNGAPCRDGVDKTSSPRGTIFLAEEDDVTKEMRRSVAKLDSS